MDNKDIADLDCDVRVVHLSYFLLDVRYKLCEPLELVCAQCYKKYVFPGVTEILSLIATPKGTSSPAAACPDPLMCDQCNQSGGLNRVSPAMLANQVVVLANLN